MTGPAAAALSLLLTINGRAVTVTAQGFEEGAARHLMQEVGNAAVPLASEAKNGTRWTCHLSRLPGAPEAAELHCEGWLLRVVRPCSSDACRWLLIERRVEDGPSDATARPTRR